MRTLDLKLLRELRRHRIQIISIALVMGCGTMTIMGLRTTLTSVRSARDEFFAEYRFADVFAHVERAPATLAPRLAAIPGVAAAETRIVRDVRLDVPGVSEPAIGHMVSIPDQRRPMINELEVRRGRWISPGSTDEVLISERFSENARLGPGDSVSAVVNGRWQRLHIVGVAISPEFVVETGGHAIFVDPSRYGIVWTGTKMMESAFDMQGAFNDVVTEGEPTWTVRFFFTANGAILEDPATGSACANLGGWHIARGRAPVSATLRQGDAVRRPSKLGLRVEGDGAIYVTGSVIDVARGAFA